MTDTPPPLATRHHNRIAALHDEVTEWRRDLHAHPEVGFEEHRTAGIVAGKLRDFGADEVITGIATTGVIEVRVRALGRHGRDRGGDQERDQGDDPLPPLR